MDFYAQSLDILFADNPDALDMFNDHIVMQATRSSIKGLDVDAKASIDGAVGVGGGLSLGIHFSYLDEMMSPKSQRIVAHGKILPMADV